MEINQQAQVIISSITYFLIYEDQLIFIFNFEDDL